MFEYSIIGLSLNELYDIRDERVRLYRLEEVDDAIRWFENIQYNYVPNVDMSPLINVLTEIKTRPFEEWRGLVAPVAEDLWTEFIPAYQNTIEYYSKSSISACDIRYDLDVQLDQIVDPVENYPNDEEHTYLLNYIRLLERLSQLEGIDT